MTRPARLLCRMLADPAMAATLPAADWTAMLAVAHAERLAGSLAQRLAGQTVPETAQRFLDRARVTAEGDRTIALWEAEMARRALAPTGISPILLKGAAYAALGLSAGQGRQIGDLDILIPRDRLDEAELALLSAGWEWVKPDPYDDAYYRDHMHELPPLIHRARDRMIDVHHTILPLTARPTPDPYALISDAVPAGEGLLALSPLDRLVHCAAHLIADGDLQGGLRNLWDFHCLQSDALAAVMDGSEPPDPVWVWDEAQGRLLERARLHGLDREVARAQRLADHLFGAGAALSLSDRLFAGRLLARDGWGRETRKPLHAAFYIRSHWLRMPPIMLAKHLWVKWRRGGNQPKA